ICDFRETRLNRCKIDPLSRMHVCTMRQKVMAPINKLICVGGIEPFRQAIKQSRWYLLSTTSTFRDHTRELVERLMGAFRLRISIGASRCPPKWAAAFTRLPNPTLRLLVVVRQAVVRNIVLACQQAS